MLALAIFKCEKFADKVSVYVDIATIGPKRLIKP